MKLLRIRCYVPAIIVNALFCCCCTYAFLHNNKALSRTNKGFSKQEKVRNVLQVKHHELSSKRNRNHPLVGSKVSPSQLSMNLLLDDGALLLPQFSAFTESLASLYTYCLYNFPLPTKALTAGFLCGIGDVLAQSRESTREEINWKRLRRFALKGCFGGIIWASYYDVSDSISESIVLHLRGLFDAGGYSGTNPVNDGSIEEVSNLSRTITSILFEQFVWCPIVYAAWEIPAATLMNGAQLRTIPDEVRSKLGGLLIANAKVWTPANVLIYNVPAEFRVGLSNLVDIWWQSIVSDVAAQCGTTEDDVCVIDDEELLVVMDMSQDQLVDSDVLAPSLQVNATEALVISTSNS